MLFSAVNIDIETWLAHQGLVLLNNLLFLEADSPESVFMGLLALEEFR